MRRGGTQSARRQRQSGIGNGLLSHERGGRGAFFLSRSFARRENQRADRGDETFAALHSTTTRNAGATQDNHYTTPIQPGWRFARGRGDFSQATKSQPVEFVLSPRPVVFSLSPLVASAGRAPFTIQPRANHKNFKGPPRRRAERLNSRYRGVVPALRRNHSLRVAN